MARESMQRRGPPWIMGSGADHVGCSQSGADQQDSPVARELQVPGPRIANVTRMIGNASSNRKRSRCGVAERENDIVRCQRAVVREFDL
jgi:hypothetical protein